MKKFFKALALVLALTLVVGTIPASAAEYEFSLKKEKKIIYLGGASGEKEVDGETIKCGTKSRYKVSKLVNGFDPATMDIKLESADKSIVKTSNAKDKVYAKSIGTTDVKIFVYDKEADKQLKDLTLKVQVKKNATAPLSVKVTQEDGTPVELTATKLGVGVPYIVTLSRKDADGNLTDTDYRKLTADKESVQIEATNKYSTQYKVTFTEAGTFNITVASYQSKIWDKPQNAITVPVVAGYDAKDAVQYSLDTIKVTFDTPVTKLDAANFKTVYVIDGVEDVEIPFADIAPNGITIDENDKTVAYVKYLMPFAANTTYKVYYGNSTEPAGTFKAVEVKADSVKQLIIPTQYVTTGVETAIKYQLLDATGVDITAGVNAVGGNVTFELTSDDGNDYIIGDSIYIKNAHAVTVTGTYHYFDADSNYKNEPSNNGQVVAQAPEAFKVGKVEGIITNDSELLVVDGKINDKAKAVEWNLDGVNNSGDGIAYLQIKVPYTKSSGTVYEGFNYTSADGTYESYDVDIADKTVAMFQGIVGGKAKLSANKVGSTSVLIYGVKGTTRVVIGVVPVTIKDTRKIGSWTVQSSSDKLNLDFGSVKYTIVVKDQDTNDYNKAYKVKVEDVTAADGTAVEILPETEYTGKAEIEITAEKMKAITGAQENAVTRNIKFTIINDNVPKTLRLSVKSDGTDAARYLLKLAGSEIKTGINGDTELVAGKNDVKVYLEGVTSNGTQASASGVAISFTKDAPKAHKYESGSKNPYYVFTITKDGKLLDAQPKQLDGTTFNAFEAGKSASDAAAKLDKGTYVINAYKFYLNGSDTWVYDNVGTAQNFTVTDDQAALTWKKTAESVAAFDDASIVGAFEIKIGDKQVKFGDAGYSFAVDKNEDDANTAYIKAIKVTVINNKGIGSYTYTINPDVLLKK